MSQLGTPLGLPWDSRGKIKSCVSSNFLVVTCKSAAKGNFISVRAGSKYEESAHLQAEAGGDGGPRNGAAVLKPDVHPVDLQLDVVHEGGHHRLPQLPLQLLLLGVLRSGSFLHD